MITNSIEVMKYVKASAGRSKLSVVFEDKNLPRHDGSTIYLPKITVHTTKEQLLEMMSSVDHEVGHDLDSDFEILKEKGIDASSSSLGLIWNLLEDSRVNYLQAVEYEGFRELWEKTTPKLIEKIDESTQKPEGVNPLIRAIMKWEHELSRKTFPLCAEAVQDMEVDPSIYTKLLPFSDRLVNVQKVKPKVAGTKGAWELARDIFRALGGDPDEEERKAKEKKKEKASSGRGVLKEASSEEDGEDKKKPVDGKNEEDGEEAEDDKDWSIVRVKSKDLKDVADKLLSLDSVDRKKMSKVGLLYEVDDLEDGWTMTALEDFIVVDYCNKTVSHPEVVNLLSDSSNEYFLDSITTRASVLAQENFANQVRRLIQIRAKSSFEYGVKRGKLDSSRLSRVALRQPGFSERVFKNKINNTVLDASVSILVDMSGSMSGDKVLFATQAALLLNDVFQVIQVPLEIIGFTDSGDKPIQYLYKPFNKHKVVREQLLSYFASSSHCMAGNPDGDSIIWAYDRIKNRTEKKKLLIVMSDGQPAASRYNKGLGKFTKQTVKEIEASRVEIYGLGLCDESVAGYYKHHSTVKTAAEIPQKLLELIDRKLFHV